MSSIAEIHFVRQLERRIQELETRLAEAEGGLRNLSALYTEFEVRLDNQRPSQAQRR